MYESLLQAYKFILYTVEDIKFVCINKVIENSYNLVEKFLCIIWKLPWSFSVIIKLKNNIQWFNGRNKSYFRVGYQDGRS